MLASLGATGSYYENNDILSWVFSTQNFGNINVCPSGQTSPAPCKATQSVAVNLAAAVYRRLDPGGHARHIAPDFTVASGGTCTGSVAAGLCTVNVTFAPQAPGLRMGAVNLFAGSSPGGTPLATTLIYGVGQGPAVAFSPGTQTTVASGLADPYSIAEDAAGNIFIATWTNGSVVKISGGTQTTLLSGLDVLEGVAVDGGGNVYTADQTSGTVLEIPAGGGAPITLVTGLNNPSGVAVDGVGNVFIADYKNNRVVEVPAGGGPQTTVGSGLSVPQGVAVDGLGDVIIADSGNNRVVKVTASGVPTTLQFTGLDDPIGVAVDAAGDVFVTNYDISDVMELTPAGAQIILPVSGFGTPGVGVTVEGKFSSRLARSSSTDLS